MKLSRNTWHYKLYRWWLEFKSKKKRCYEVYVLRNGSRYNILLEDATDDEIVANINYIFMDFGKHNLCTYIRVVLLYAPTRFLFYTDIGKLAAINTILYGAVIYMLANINSYFTMTIMVNISILIQALLAAIIAAIIVTGIVPGIIHVFKWSRNTLYDVVPEDTFYSTVVKPYCKSVKEKVCYFIEFEDEEPTPPSSDSKLP